GGIVIKLIVLGLKMGGFIIFYMLIRWTIPRFRFDQLMALAWKVLIPLSLLNVICVMVVRQLHWSYWALLGLSLVLFVGAGLFSIRSTPPARPSRIMARREAVSASPSGS